MELIYVYNISDKVEKRTDITDEYIENINKIFIKLLGSNEEGISGQVRKYTINTDLMDHKLLKLKKDYFKEEGTEELIDFLDSFASDLLQAELVKDDSIIRRNKSITQGMLLIKKLATKIIFLKLEEIDSINKKTFEITDAFGAERKYYKAAIYSGQGINVIDKNNADYWVQKFLNIEPVRDNATNTEDLINLIESNKIFNNKILDSQYKEDVIKSARNYIMKGTTFDIEDMSHAILQDIDDEDLSQDEIFNMDEVAKIDSGFTIDSKTLNDNYKCKLQLNDNIILNSKNIVTAIKAQKIIQISNNSYIQIKIDESYKDKVKDLFNKYG